MKRGSPVSATITLEEAQAKLGELIGRLTLGEEIVITQNAKPRGGREAGWPTPLKAQAAYSRKLQGNDHTRRSGRRAFEGSCGVHAVRLLLDTHALRSSASTASWICTESTGFGKPLHE
jgi:hypothetical protein